MVVVVVVVVVVVGVLTVVIPVVVLPVVVFPVFIPVVPVGVLIDVINELVALLLEVDSDFCGVFEGDICDEPIEDIDDFVEVFPDEIPELLIEVTLVVLESDDFDDCVDFIGEVNIGFFDTVLMLLDDICVCVRVTFGAFVDIFGGGDGL